MAPAEQLAPEFLVRVAGSDLPQPAAADLLHVMVQEDVAAPAMFACELLNWDGEKAVMKWSDEDTFREGKALEIRVGYRDDLKVLINGEITALELTVASSEVPTLSVQGYDRSHRLMRTRRVRTFVDVTDSDIARRVAEDLGLAAEVAATSGTYSYVVQSNQTDFEFLHERAARIGYEVIVQNKTLRFRPRPLSARGSVTLHREKDLLEFRARLSTLAPASKTTVRGWNPQTKEGIVGKAAGSDAAAKMGGSTHGAASVEKAFGENSSVAILSSPSTQGEADQMARAAIDEAALGYIEAEGACFGRADVRAGSVISVEGVGKRFSGPYYVTSTTHTYTPAHGYRTRFAARRNAS